MRNLILLTLVATLLFVGCQSKQSTDTKQNGNGGQAAYDYLEATEDVLFTLDNEPAFTIKTGTVVMIDQTSDGYEALINDLIYKSTSHSLRGVDQIPLEPTVRMISADKITLKAGTQLIDKEGQVLFMIEKDFEPIHYIRQMDIHGELMYELIFCGRVVYASPKTVASDFD